MSSPSAAELHLLYVLLDSNLPTGGFVSSSGLESYAKHGFLASTQTYTSKHAPSVTAVSRKISPAKGLMDFTLAELDNYASTTLCFVSDAWRAVDTALADSPGGKATVADIDDVESRIGNAINAIEALDQYHDTALLSHVARRSSKAQGVAMLTLYGRGLSAPPGLDEYLTNLDGRNLDLEKSRRTISDGIIDKMKRMIRLGKLPGHLATSWGVITAALGLPLGKQPVSDIYHRLHILTARSSLARASLPTHPLAALVRRSIQPYRSLRVLAASVTSMSRTHRTYIIKVPRFDHWASI